MIQQFHTECYVAIFSSLVISTNIIDDHLKDMGHRRIFCRLITAVEGYKTLVLRSNTKPKLLTLRIRTTNRFILKVNCLPNLQWESTEFAAAKKLPMMIFTKPLNMPKYAHMTWAAPSQAKWYKRPKQYAAKMGQEWERWEYTLFNF